MVFRPLKSAQRDYFWVVKGGTRFENNVEVNTDQGQKAKNTLFATQIDPESLFWAKCETRLEHQWGHPDKPPLLTQNRPSGPNWWKKGYFSLFLPFLGHSRSYKWPKLDCLDVLFGVPTFFHTFQPKISSLGRFVRQKGYFCLFLPL